MLLVIAWCASPQAGYAQLEADTTTLIGRIQVAAEQGQQRALRDLATLADHPEQRQQVRDLLVRLTLLHDDIDVSTASRQQLLDYYYRYSDSLRYSTLLRAYYRRPIEQQSTRYELVSLDAYQLSDRSMHLRKYIEYIEQAVEFESVTDLRDLVEKIADLQLLEGQAYLLALLQTDAGALLAANPDAFLHYLDQLMTRPSVEVAEALFASAKHGFLQNGTLSYYLSRLCNMPFRASWSVDEQASRYQTLVDSLGGLARVREAGYASSVSFTRNHFREPVDYYGRVLAKADVPDYVKHNALLDLINTHHPRALFYISTQLLAARRAQPTAHHAVHYLYLLRKLTKLGVLVPDNSGQFVYQLDVAGDAIAWLNYVRYYAGHYEDYDYDEHRLSFVNRYDHSLETENLERLFRLLNSENDEVALQAYERIARADPLEVQQLVNKYKDLLRSTNAKVPALKNGHLEQTAQLTAFCVRNRLSFNAEPALSVRLDSLLLMLDPSRRVALENRLIASLKLTELTAVEYWALMHQYDQEAGFSIGRILDYAYSKHWQQMLESDSDLRLYLKKAMLFARMDGIGVSDGYLHKFAELDGALRARLADLLVSEGDKHISRAIKRLLNDNEAQANGGEELDNFLETPVQFAKDEINLLPRPTLEQMDELLWRLKDPSPKAKYLYSHYLEAILNVDLVPDLMSLLMREESPQAVAEMLFQIYAYQFEEADGEPSEQWLDYWRKHNTSYKEWGKTFYDRHLQQLRQLPKLTGRHLNAVLRSPYYRESDRQLVLESLAKLVSNRHLFMLRFEPELAWQERVVLSGLQLGYKDLQDLDKLFPAVPPAELVEYILTEAADFAPGDRGQLFNALMRKPWIEELLDDERFATRAEEVRKGLAWYLEESELLSEYEEQNTALNLARLDFMHKQPAERLRMSVDLDVDEAAKLRIQESILSRVPYQQLPQVLALAPQFADVNGTRPYNFLNQDFGLPIFNLESAAVIDTFAARHERLSPVDLYATYLSEFGLQLYLPSGALDYEMIAQILRYDIVLPFIGGGGNRRDLYTYGVIKLLELTEETRLGFHEKLNENQLFYSFTASRRAAAWLSYLQEEGRLSLGAAALQPSFNISSSN